VVRLGAVVSGGRAEGIIEAVTTAIRARREQFDDADLRSLMIDVKLNAKTGGVRVILVVPTYEVDPGAGDADRPGRRSAVSLVPGR
jgi:hypothetical protein